MPQFLHSPPRTGACPSNGRDCDGSEMSRMRDGGSSRLLMMSLRDPTTKQAGHFRPTRRAACFLASPRGAAEPSVSGTPSSPFLVEHRMVNPVVDPVLPTNHRLITTVLYDATMSRPAKNHVVATRPLLGQAPRR